MYHVGDKRWRIFPYLYGQTGLRKSEIAALQWKDFDLNTVSPFVRVLKASELRKEFTEKQTEARLVSDVIYFDGHLMFALSKSYYSKI